MQTHTHETCNSRTLELTLFPAIDCPVGPDLDSVGVLATGTVRCDLADFTLFLAALRLAASFLMTTKITIPMITATTTTAVVAAAMATTSDWDRVASIDTLDEVVRWASVVKVDVSNVVD